jgi:hypothetical protein
MEGAGQALAPHQRYGHASSLQRRQRALRPGATVSRLGALASQAGCAIAQRGANRHPDGIAQGCGTAPGMAERRSASPSGVLAISAAV